MTAARSDLMALDREAFIAAHKHLDLTEDKDGWGRPKFAHDMVQALWDGWHKGRSALRLAASQPDRDAVKEFIASASFASRSSLDSDTIFCEIYTPGYQPAKKGSFGFFVKELRAILSLLSGAGTKSDGGVEADTRANETAKALMAHPSPMGSRSCDEKTIACGVAGVAPGPSDPSPGPDVRRRDAPRVSSVSSYRSGNEAILSQSGGRHEDEARNSQGRDSQMHSSVCELPRETALGGTANNVVGETAPNAVAETRRAGSAGISPPEVFAAPISSVEER